MAKAWQYWNGSGWSQGTFTTTDTLFHTIKDKDDNQYIFSEKSTGQMTCRKMDKTGVILATSGNLGQSMQFGTLRTCLSKDSSKIFYLGNTAALKSIDTATLQTVRTEIGSLATGFYPFAIYKDLYIWIASGTTVKVYDYTTKVEKASTTVESDSYIVVDSNNICYTHSKSGNYFTVRKLIFDGTDTITNTLLYQPNSYSNLTYQMTIDIFGDLIFLNDSTNSRLIKFSTITNDIIDTKDLGQKCGNLSIDTKGNYYYQTALATFKIAKNDAQGQAFNPIPAEPIRATGNIGYGSNITGYQPSVYA